MCKTKRRDRLQETKEMQMRMSELLADEQESKSSPRAAKSAYEKCSNLSDTKGASTRKSSTTNRKDENEITDAPFVISKCRQSTACQSFGS